MMMRIALPGPQTREKLNQWWWAWGIALPALLPVAEALGRGAVNSLFTLYALVLLPFLWRRRQQLETGLLLLFLLLFAVDFIGAARSIDPGRGLHQWLKYSASLLFFFAPVALCREGADAEVKVERSCRALGYAALATLALVVAKSLQESAFGALIMPHALMERNLPFLFFFFLYLAGRDRRVLPAVAVAVTALVLVLSRGRSAMAGWLAGIGVYGPLVRCWRLRRVALVYLVAAVLGATVLVGFVYRQTTPAEQTAGFWDRFTSGRSVIWASAIEHPPANPWLGIGIDNLRGYRDVLAIRRGDTLVKVGHLHNLFMDAWYETGVLGLGLLVGLLGRLIWRAGRAWRRADGLNRRRLGTVLAAVIALLAASMLSFSYTSAQCSIYLFYLLGLAHCIERRLLVGEGGAPT